MYNKNNKGPKVIPWGIPLVTKGLEGGEAQRHPEEDVSFDLVHFVCHIWRKYRFVIAIPLAKDTTDSHLLFPAIHSLAHSRRVSGEEPFVFSLDTTLIL